ncbi:MAG: hypothetical protein EOM83_13725 [Clostridia bacterium]|nr:hypothetical protein [Clostridia bacterium]
MKAPVITLANDTYRSKSLVRLNNPATSHWLRNYATHLHKSATRYELLWHKSSNTAETYPVGNYNLIWQLSTTTDFSIGVNTHVADKILQKIKSPFGDLQKSLILKPLKKEKL